MAFPEWGIGKISVMNQAAGYALKFAEPGTYTEEEEAKLRVLRDTAKAGCRGDRPSFYALGDQPGYVELAKKALANYGDTDVHRDSVNHQLMKANVRMYWDLESPGMTPHGTTIRDSSLAVRFHKERKPRVPDVKLTTHMGHSTSPDLGKGWNFVMVKHRHSYTLEVSQAGSTGPAGISLGGPRKSAYDQIVVEQDGIQRIGTFGRENITTANPGGFGEASEYRTTVNVEIDRPFKVYIVVGEQRVVATAHFDPSTNFVQSHELAEIGLCVDCYDKPASPEQAAEEEAARKAIRGKSLEDIFHRSRKQLRANEPKPGPVVVIRDKATELREAFLQRIEELETEFPEEERREIEKRMAKELGIPLSELDYVFMEVSLVGSKEAKEMGLREPTRTRRPGTAKR